jgi:LacI family transcriptional regulator
MARPTFAAIAARIAADDRPRAALVIAAPDAPSVRQAPGAVVAAGLPVVQVVTRILPEVPFLGIDNHAAGRMAGLLVAPMARRAGPVMALCHSGGYAVHRLRIRGFSDHLARHPDPARPFVLVAFGQGDDSRGRRSLAEVPRLWPDLAAV